MNFTTLDLNLLRVFDALYSEQSATRAGKRLGLSQPAVSAALNRLRQVVGDRLFVRQGSRMVPTTKALALHDPVRQALASVEQALTGIASFDPSQAERTLRLFGSDYFAEVLMPRLSAEIAEEAPSVILQLIDNGRGNMVGQLSDRVIDLALEPTEEVPEWISQELILQSTMTIVASAKNPVLAERNLRSGDLMPLDILCSLPHAFCSPSGTVSGLLDKALADVGRARRVHLTLPTFYNLAVVVSQAPFAAILPTAIAKKYQAGLGLSLFAAPLEMPRVDLHMYWHRRHDDDQAHKWLREKVRQVLRPYDEREEAS